MTLNPGTLYDSRQCLDECPPDYKDIFNGCYKQKKNGLKDEVTSDAVDILYDSTSEQLLQQSTSIIAVFIIALILSLGTLFLFRYAIKYIIWIVIISSIVLQFFSSALFTFSFLNVKAGGGCLLSGSITLILVITFRKRIILVAKLFKEASKVLIDVPGILFEPILVRFS